MNGIDTSSPYVKLLVIVLIFLGESFSIYAEMIAARAYAPSNPFIQIFLRAFFVITIAGGILVLCYMFAFSIFKNIWVVSVISITPILIMEPTLAYAIFHQLPTKGALIGFVLGAIGFVSTILVR